MLGENFKPHVHKYCTVVYKALVCSDGGGYFRPAIVISIKVSFTPKKDVNLKREFIYCML